MLSNAANASGLHQATPTYHAPRPRNSSKRDSAVRFKPYTQLPTPTPSPSSASHSPPPSDRWTCGVPNCKSKRNSESKPKSYGRVYDLERHLVSVHGDALYGADDATLLSAGISATQLESVRAKLDRRFVCAACRKKFSRSDALARHMDEQGHRRIVPSAGPTLSSTSQSAPPNAPAGYAWQLVPLAVPNPTPPFAPFPAQMMDWSIPTFGSAGHMPDPVYYDPTRIWSPASSSSSEGYQPVAPAISDLHDFPPLPVLDASSSELALFPDDALFADVLRLCAGAPVPSEAEVTDALAEWLQKPQRENEAEEASDILSLIRT